MKDWKKEFKEEFGAFAIMGPAGRIYNGAFANEARLKPVIEYIDSLLASQLEELDGKIEKLRSECTCGCNFKDGCLCKEEKRGFDKCKVQVKSIIKEIKEK